MATLDIRNKDGKKVGTHEVAKALASAAPKDAVLHRAVVAEMANARQGTQSAKTRSEVRGGGKKPYRQKKTGNARQGTRRAPHFAHGGVAFAPKPRDYDKQVNRKERRSAILGALNSKIEAGEVVVADAIQFAEPRTKQAVDLLRALDLQGVKRLLVVLPEHDETTLKCFRNMPHVIVRTAPSAGKEPAAKSSAFSARDLLVAHRILVARDALTKIEEVWAS